LTFDLGIDLVIDRSAAFIINEYVHVITSVYTVYV